MKAEPVSSRSSSGKKSGLRYLDLSFEGKELTFKNGELDNGRLPHGGYKGSKKHPMGIYSFDKGREHQRLLRDDLDRLLENDVLEVHGSPSWALEAHRQPTHSGESPLLTNKFMSPSKHEAMYGTGKWNKDTSKPNRCSALPSNNGVLYYRPNRMHQYLSATELKDASDCDEVLRYGRPTRTTLLRARHRVGSPSANAYEMRRQSEQRMEEIKNSSIFSNPKEFAQPQTEVDGVSIHSFLTGARYNRAHCLDSKSLTQYGVYMPRNNPLGCFVIGQRADIFDTTSAPPDSPRSDLGEATSPITERRRPTTAPGYGRKPLMPVPRTPRQAWGDATSSHHVTNGDHRKGDNENGSPVIEEIKVWSSKFNVKGSRFRLNLSREGPQRFESRLPSVRGTSLSKLRRLREATDDMSDANQPPPSPVPTSARVDNSFPNVKPEAETDRKSDPQKGKIEPDSKPQTTQPKPEVGDNSITVPSPAASVATREENPQDKGEKPEGKGEGGENTAEEAEKVSEEEEGKEVEHNSESQAEAGEAVQKEEVLEPSSQVDEQAPAASDVSGAETTGDDAKPSADGTESENAEEKAGNVQSPVQEAEQKTDVDKVTSQEGSEELQPAGTREVTEEGDDVKFFLTEDGAGGDETADGAETKADEVADVDDGRSTDNKSLEEDQMSTASSNKSKGKRSVTFSDLNADESKDVDTAEQVEMENSDPENRFHPSDDRDRAEAQDTDVDDHDQGQGQSEPLKVIVTHIERGMGAPVPKETVEEVIEEDP